MKYLKSYLKTNSSNLAMGAFALVFFGIAIASTFGFITNKADFQSSLLALPITISIFSVNFSFFGYQFSPYRSILKQISFMHVSIATLMLIVSLFPIMAYFVRGEFAATLSVAFILPCSVFSGIFVLFLSSREISPQHMLNTYSSENKVNEFYLEYGTKIKKHQEEIDSWGLSKPKDKPQHEWDILFDPPAPDENPVELALSLFLLSVQHLDSQQFVHITNKILQNARLSYAIESKVFGDRGYKITTSLQKYALSSLVRAVQICIDSDKSGTFCDRLNKILLFEIKKMAHNSEQTTDFCIALTSVSFMLSDSLLRNKKQSEGLAFISAIRQVAQKGIDNPLSKDDSEDHRALMHDFSLKIFPSYIQKMGEGAISIDDSDFLYRCTEGLCWLGCSAVKAGNAEVVRSCLQGLSYLGRLSKFHKMTCFWSRCALDPIDHARENIQSMLTWVPSAPESARSSLLSSVEEALSRINGSEYKIEITYNENKDPKIVLTDLKKPYKVEWFVGGIGQIGTSGEIDYSDFSMIKDHVLH